MKGHRDEFPLRELCCLLNVSRSGYYDWAGRSPSLRQFKARRDETAVRAAHIKTRETYGSRRLHKELQAEGWGFSQWKVRRLREKLGLRCKQARRFKATTNSRHRLPVASNQVDQCFAPTQPNALWVTDITYIPSDEGWLYLAGVKDVYTCEIVGYAMDSRMTQGLVKTALHRAIMAKKPPPGLMHHSDRGSQYCAHDYQQQLKEAGIQVSMSRKGNCYDNAPMESFWGSLKNELVHHRRYRTRQEAQQEITEYIEIFYNRQRRHSRLGDIAPATFANQFIQNKKITTMIN